MNEQSLFQAIEKYRDIPFDYGSHDCCLFAANVTRDVHGFDPAKKLRGTYRSHLGAAKLIKRYNGLENLVNNVLGFQAVAPALARRGDLVLGVVDGREAVGVSVGSKAVFVGPEDLQVVPIALVVRCWHIGEPR